MNLQHWFGLNVIIIYPLVLTEQGTQRLTGAQTNQWSLLAINKELRLRKKRLGLRRSPRRISTSEHTSSIRPVSRECNYSGNYRQFLPGSVGLTSTHLRPRPCGKLFAEGKMRDNLTAIVVFWKLLCISRCRKSQSHKELCRRHSLWHISVQVSSAFLPPAPPCACPECIPRSTVFPVQRL